MLLLVIWAGLAVVAFALIYQGSGSRFLEKGSPVGFGTLLYMSGSTFLTLGLGDVTSADSLGRMFMIFEAATGFVFLGLIITYMPLLDQAYASREVGSLLLQSRAGKPPNAVRLLRRYAGTDRSEILRGNLREGEHWMADILQSHLSHPVLCFYRAQHYGQSWLVSLTTLLDTCSLLIVGGEGLVREQARLTYRMGLLLLADLASALELTVPTRVDTRLTEADLPALRAALSSEGIALRLGPTEGTELVRINHRYDVYLHVMSRWLMITLPPWIPPAEDRSAEKASNTPKPGIRSSRKSLRPAIRPHLTDLAPFESNRLAMQITPTTYGALTAMITPAIFMTANASLIISTSNRVSRVVDRIRVLNDLADKLDRGLTDLDFPAQRLDHIHDQMRRLERRSDRLRFALTALYLAFTTFVGTSLTLAIDAMLQNWLVALPTLLAVIGVGLLLFASVNLVLEALEALRSNRLETGFYRELHELRHAEKSDANFAPPIGRI